jgi:filamentous hemagglutinin family protein
MELVHSNSNPNQNHGKTSFCCKVASGSLVFTAIIFLFASIALALPQDGQVQSGDVQLNQVTSKRLDVNQSSDKAIIDWRSFNIAEGEHTHFQLPSNNSINLSRVIGGQRSDIFGKLSSNGQLMLINPNGVVFGRNSRIDVHGLIATTNDIRNQDFLANRFHFSIPGNPFARIVNRGTINIGRAGLLAFVAPGVENSGIINARLGRVGLASSNQFTLDLYGDNLITLGVEGKVLEKIYGEDGKPISSLVDNKGTINADGGQVYLQTNAARDIVDHAINVSGIIEAKTAVKKRGNIILNGGIEGKVRVSGVLDASGLDSGQTGGTVHVLGDEVILEKARIFASGYNGGGTVLVGGDYQGKGSVLNSRNTYFDTQSVIYGDAIYEGNGGKIILWADERTDALGKIYARGGSVGGDGGFVETSGKERLVVTQAADVSAPFGKPGEWLLDPFDIEIVDSLDNAALKGGNKVDVAIINAALNNGTSVKIQSNNNGEGEGNILLSSAIVKTSGGNSTLTLDAAGGITINKSITSSAGALTLDLIAATGVVLNESLVLNGGSVTLNSNETFNRPNNINPGSQNIVQTNHVSGVSQGAVAHVSGSPGGSVHLSGNQNKTNASANHGNEILLGDFFQKIEKIPESFITRDGKKITYMRNSYIEHIKTSGGKVIFKDKVKIDANKNNKIEIFKVGNTTVAGSDDFRINSGGGSIIFQDQVESVSGGFKLNSGGGNMIFQGKLDSGSEYFNFYSADGNITFEDDVNLGTYGLTLFAGNGNVIFKKTLNKNFMTTNESFDNGRRFFLVGGNITFNEIGNIRSFNNFYVSSSSKISFLGKSNFNGRFYAGAKDGIEISENMTINALRYGNWTDSIHFDADTDWNGVGILGIVKGSSLTKNGKLSITSAGFDMLQIKNGSVSNTYIYDTKIRRGFRSYDSEFYKHISGLKLENKQDFWFEMPPRYDYSVDLPTVARGVSRISGSSTPRYSNWTDLPIVTPVVSRISGNSTPNIWSNQTILGRAPSSNQKNSSNSSVNKASSSSKTINTANISDRITSKSKVTSPPNSNVLTARISGSSTPNFTVLQTSSTTLIKKRPSSANLIFSSEKKLSKKTETPEQVAINAAITVKNQKIDAEIKEIRNRLVAARATGRLVVPENRIAPKTLQQNVTGLWTRLVGENKNPTIDSKEDEFSK